MGIIVISSATYVNIEGTSDEYTRQKIWFITGLVLMVIAALVDYHFITRFYIPLYIINLILLITVILLPNPGYSTARTLQLGASVSITPSEFAKIFMILSISKFVDKHIANVNNLFTLAIFAVVAVVPIYLIKEQPSLSASLVVLIVMVSILFVAKLNYIFFITGISALSSALILLINDIKRESPLFIDNFLKDYQMERILLLLFPDPKNSSYYQTNQSINAIGSGQLNGKGLYNGLLNQGIHHVPAADNDFIFAVIGEEFGFIGGSVFLFLMLMIVLKCFIVAHKASDLLGKLIASSVGTMFAFQTFVNVGVATGILPNTGMAFPFVSYGGSAMWVSMIGVGLVLNVSMSKHKSIFES